MEKDLCKSCSNYWVDFPLPLEQSVSHCAIVDKKYGISSNNKMNEIVPYPCTKCPFDCYSKKK